MKTFRENATGLKGDSVNDSRSPLNDPFYAESLIIQSKSIVGKMYSRNEYVRFKYDCEINQLVRGYKVWIAEIKRKEREILQQLEAMREEQREILKQQKDLNAIQNNREFINHYKRQKVKRRKNTGALYDIKDTFPLEQQKKHLHLHRVPRQVNKNVKAFEKDTRAQFREKNAHSVLRLPKIAAKEHKEIVLVTKSQQTNLPGILKVKEEEKSAERQVECMNFPAQRDLQSSLLKQESCNLPIRNPVNVQRNVIDDNSINFDKTQVVKQDTENKTSTEDAIEPLWQQDSSSFPSFKAEGRRARAASVPSTNGRDFEVTELTRGRPSSVAA